jgi:hypothetical protein
MMRIISWVPDMQLESLHDRDTIRRLLEVDRGRFAYLLGDLDPFFWGRTVWFAAAEAQRHRAVLLLYLSHRRPVALIFGQDDEALCWLLEAVTPILPAMLYGIRVRNSMIALH